MRVSVRTKYLVSVALALGTALGSIMAGASSAQAAAISRSPGAIAAVVKGTMTTECRVRNVRRVSRSALASRASVRTLCARAGIPGSGPAAARGITPDSTVSGNCGESFLYIYSTSTSGETRFRSGAYPWYSEIDYGLADFLAQNLSKGGYQTWSDGVWANTNGWWWSGDDYKFTKTGIVFSYMYGDVLLFDGTICSIDYPTDEETIH